MRVILRHCSCYLCWAHSKRGIDSNRFVHDGEEEMDSDGVCGGCLMYCLKHFVCDEVQSSHCGLLSYVR